MTALEIRAALATVDGAGSGIDADLLDGLDSGAFAPSSHVGSGGSAHANATTSTAGFMASSDKTKLDGLSASSSGAVYASTSVPAGNTFSNTSAENAFASSYTLPANTLVVGKPYRITARGLLGTGSNVCGFTFRIKIGSVTVFNSGSVSVATNVADGPWEIETIVVPVTLGASGTIEAQGRGSAEKGASTNFYRFLGANTAPLTLDTTASQAITVTMQMSIVGASATGTLRQLIVEAL
jgi:hypothetical protein